MAETILRQAAATGNPSPPVNFQGVKFGQISSFYTVRDCRFRTPHSNHRSRVSHGYGSHPMD
jgi:hypothetical protein